MTLVNCIPYPLSNQTHPKVHSVMIFLVYFLVPLAVISIYYYHIARTLIRSAHDMPGEVSEHTKRQVSHTHTHARTIGGQPFSERAMTMTHVAFRAVW